MSVERQTPEQRREYGRSLREKAPRQSHADWSPAGDRDPVGLVEGQNEDRWQWLVPVRRARMSASPFAFYRGGARIMACDLAPAPVSGLVAQICGDAHLANFGAYASPERRLVFDLNDFDETLPGPWEWDVKRLAASFVIAARHNRLKKKHAREITRHGVARYRKAMERLAGMRLTDGWYHLVDTTDVVAGLDDKKLRKVGDALIRKAKRKNSRQALDKLAEQSGDVYRIRSEPPLLIPLRDLGRKYDPATLRGMTESVLADYLRTAPDDVEHLVRKFRLVDVAVKVVGVGSVGTRCYVVLLEGRDGKDPLFLQIKEASRSVLEEYLPRSRYENPGERVVEGQRLMQTVSDIFLGWAEGEFSGSHYYVRQLKDWKASAEVEGASYDALHAYAGMRGATLARSHARTGDPVAISGYLGSSDVFDKAVTEFAERYADQNERDYQAFLADIKTQGLEVAEIE
jgi:uncharacterized protein (DUF2252 family)